MYHVSRWLFGFVCVINLTWERGWNGTGNNRGRLGWEGRKTSKMADERDPSERVRKLVLFAGQVHVDNSIAPKKYFRSGIEMEKMVSYNSLPSVKFTESPLAIRYPSILKHIVNVWSFAEQKIYMFLSFTWIHLSLF